MRHVRFLLLVIMVTSSVIVYVNRTNLNIAIVSMTKQHETTSNVSGCPIEHPIETPVMPDDNGTTPAPRSILLNAITETNREDDKKYDWDQSTQGLVLGSFFYSYFVFQVPSGMMAERFGGKHVMLLALIGSAFGSLITPFIADLHFSVLCVVRAFVGFCQSGFFPASFGIACKWMPLKERSFAFAVIEVGSNIGSVLTFYAAGYIITAWGWPVLFHVASGSAIVMTLVSFFMVRNEPTNHPLIENEELEIIRSGQEDAPVALAKKKIPWKGILTNKSVIAATIFKFSYIWMFSLFYLEMPKYLHEVLHEDIVHNGQTNAIINILVMVSVAGTGYASEKVIEWRWLTRTATRKSFALFNGFGYALVVAFIPSVGCHLVGLKVLLYTSALLQGFNAGSSIPIVSEMSQNFPSLLYSILNMAAMATGILVPSFVGWILDSTEDQIHGWNIIFYTSSAILAVATVVYLVFAKAERQQFDMIEDEEERRRSDNNSKL